MALSSRASRLAFVEETTAGTLKLPTSTGEYVALQDGFTLTPSFSALESAELKSSIGASKIIQGLEAPTASLSHYIYHSGVEATVPEIDLLLEGIFGDKSAAPSETTSTTGTTTAQIELTSATGYEKGQSLLIKDATNGYSIRPISALSGTTATLGISLASAPANGTSLGRPVLYKPGDSSHPSLSIWDYRGNGAAVQAIAGVKVSEMSISITAGELTNASFSMEGTKFFFNPIDLTSTSNKLTFNDGGSKSITLTAKTYKDPYEAAEALQTAMDAASAFTITVSYSDSTGKFTVTSSSSLTSIQWATATDTLGAKFGFTADDGSGTSFVSDAAYTLTSPQTPALDGSDPLAAKNNEVYLGASTDTTCFKAQNLTITVSNEIASVNEICAETGQAEKVINGRKCEVEFDATLTQYEADKFRRYRANTATPFFLTFGPKSGGNYVAGKCASFFIPQCTISEFSLENKDEVVIMKGKLQAFTSSGEGEVYMNFL